MKKILLFICSVLMITSCTEEQDANSLPLENPKGEEIVLQERDSYSPLILSKNTLRDVKSASPATGKSILGKGLKLKVFPIETPDNLGYPIIDIAKLEKDNQGYTEQDTILLRKAESFAFDGYDRYETNSSLSTQISWEIKPKFSFGSAGIKKTMDETFKTSNTQVSKMVMAEQNIEAGIKNYKLIILPSVLDRIKTQYLSNVAKEALYESSISNALSFIGCFVLTDYIVGGKATVLYSAEKSESMSGSVIEKKMNTTVDASLTFGAYGGSSSLSIGGESVNRDSVSSSLKKIKYSIKTIGGGGGFPVFSPPQNLDSPSLDMSGWLKSVDDPNLQTLIKINEKGLYPLSSFLLEANFKNAIDHYLAGNDALFLEKSELQEPRIEIYPMLCSFGSEKMQTYPVLITRFGDAIVIKSNTLPMPVGYNYIDQFPIDVQKNLERLSQFYKLKITSMGNHFAITEDEIDSPDFSASKYLGRVPNTLSHLEFRNAVFIPELDESKMKKFVSDYNGFTYLLYSDGVNKYGFSIHDEYILDTYGIKQWVNSLPQIKDVDYKELCKYKLIAL